MKPTALRFIVALGFLFIAAQYNFGQITVSFQSPESWTQVYCYVWGPNDFLGVWPGTLMTEETDNWYTISTDTLSSGNFIFNNGTGDDAVQSVNQYLTTGIYCFKPTGALVGTEIELEEVDCEAPVSNTYIKQDKSSGLTIFPNPAEDILNIHSDRKIDWVQIYSLTGAQLVQVPIFANVLRINIAYLEADVYILKVIYSDGYPIAQRIIRK